MREAVRMHSLEIAARFRQASSIAKALRSLCEGFAKGVAEDFAEGSAMMFG